MITNLILSYVNIINNLIPITMEDYQILIDLAWSQNPDIFGIIRKYLQDHLDNRRPFLAEFQDGVGRVIWVTQPRHRLGTHPSETINDLFIRSKINCMRALLPVKISRNPFQLHHRNHSSTKWMTPIDTIHR